MKKLKLQTVYKKLLSDVFTPVGIYLRLRDRFRDTVLLESSDYNSAENSFSFIGINAIGGIEIRNPLEIEIKYPNQEPFKETIDKDTEIADELWKFMQVFQVIESAPMPIVMAQGLFGYTSYDAFQLFGNFALNNTIDYPVENDTISSYLFSEKNRQIPLIRYRLYQYVIAINHFKNELYICENKLDGVDGDSSLIESIIKSKDIPAYPFSTIGWEATSPNDEMYKAILEKGIQLCSGGDISKIFLSREYTHQFIGDEFNVYRALRNVNPGPYLFYFDYGDYRLIGSGSGIGFHQIEVNDETKNLNPFKEMADTFPNENFSGIPKTTAIELIHQLEIDNRGYFGGNIGFIGFDGRINHASMVHTFLSKNCELKYRAGTILSGFSDVEQKRKAETDESQNLTQAIKSAELNSRQELPLANNR